MDWKTFYRRKKEINCEICSSELVGDIIESDHDSDIKIQQILELVSYSEAKSYRKGKIDILKCYRRINLIENKEV